MSTLDPVNRMPHLLTEDPSGDLFLIYAQLKLETFLFSGEEVTREQLASLFRDPEKTEPAKPASVKFFQRLPQLFTIPRNRRAVVGSCVVMIAQYVQLRSNAFSCMVISTVTILNGWANFHFLDNFQASMYSRS